jgi:hypothetical protein
MVIGQHETAADQSSRLTGGLRYRALPADR